MKKLSFLFLSLAVMATAKAQSPQALNYQAVARNSVGAPMIAQAVSVRFSVLEGSVNGPALYVETHTGTTNNFGLFTLAIGRGTAVSGTFAGVNWGGGEKFLKVEVSTDGGSTYAVQGTSQFLSVPYALYAHRANIQAGNAINITGGNTISGAYTPGNGIAINGAQISHALTAGTGININGAQISHALTAGNGIAINGAQISGAYQGGTGIGITGNTITNTMQAGTGIAITGATISHNFVAGNGINITGNTISSTNANSQWVSDANGIHYLTGNIGVRANASASATVNILQQNLNGGAGINLESNDIWHSAITMANNTVGGGVNRYTFAVGGATNGEIGARNLGIMNHNLVKWALIINGMSNNVGIGMNNLASTEQPKSKLHVFGGDVNIEQIGSGIIMKSPNGSCWRVTLDNSGNLVRTAITCP